MASSLVISTQGVAGLGRLTASQTRCGLCNKNALSPVPSFEGLWKLPQVKSSFAVTRELVSTRRRTLLCPRALDLDSDQLVAIGVGFAGLAVGIGIPVFFEIQAQSSELRENDQPCFPCRGSGAQSCRFCLGTGSITVDLGAGETEVSKCINCDGAGTITCTTCQGSGLQPRYLDRREFKDDD